MASQSPAVSSRGGRRCVAGGCNMMKEIAENVSLHSFPLDRPAILRQWITFVHNSRKNWNGPTKHSLLCSRHFTADCYPPKFTIMESVGMPVKRRFLEKDAVPTIHFRDSDAQELPASSMSPVVSTPVATLPPTPSPRPMMCSTPKKPRRAFQKREVQRIMLDFGKAVEQPIVTSDIQDESVMEPVQEVMCTDAEDHSSQNSIQVHEEISSAPDKETRSVGSQLSMMKPQRRSHYTQTKWKGYDKDTQTVNSQEKRDVGVTCNLLKAPPLESKASRKAEDQRVRIGYV